MLDFASSLYLGMRHGSRTLAPWEALTLGRPAALEEPPAAIQVAHELATLVGCESGVLLPSCFHLFWDLLGVLSREPIEIFMDASTYPIARWGAEHWAAKGTPLHTFAHHDPAELMRLLARRSGRRPVVISDGVNPGSTTQPALTAYAELAHRHGGWLLIDDTQALGVYGHHPTPGFPYGHGGGGSLQRHGLSGGHLIVGASLAKGFGVPLALLAGDEQSLRRFRRDSASREHMSPPSLAVVHAARQALAVNRRHGQWLRGRLWRAVQRLRSGLAALGLATRGGDFPMQTLAASPRLDARKVHARLLRAGVATVLQRTRSGGAQLSFLLRADHNAEQIDRGLSELACACRESRIPASSRRRHAVL